MNKRQKQLTSVWVLHVIPLLVFGYYEYEDWFLTTIGVLLYLPPAIIYYLLPKVPVIKITVFIFTPLFVFWFITVIRGADCKLLQFYPYLIVLASFSLILTHLVNIIFIQNDKK